jgi:hypothetical protein
MNRTTKVILAGIALAWLGSSLPAPVSAGNLVAHPETLFAKGMKFSERHGQNKGVIHLNSRGSAVISWNGVTHWGRWEKVDEYHVRTIWKQGGPPGGVWSIRETGNSAVPYIAIRKGP